MQHGIGGADVAQELVSEALTLAGPPNEPGNVHNLDHCWDDLLGVDQSVDFIESPIGNRHDAHIGLNRAEGVVGALCSSCSQSVEQGGFAHIGETYNTGFHDLILSRGRLVSRSQGGWGPLVVRDSP